MDVKYIPADWEKMRSGLKNLIGKSVYGKGMIDELKDISSNFEEAESDISRYDSDGVISFTHTDREKTYQGLFEDFEVLYSFSGKVGDIVDRTIDQPFYEDIDAFVTEVRELSISNYKTKNRIGVTDIVYSPESYGGSIEVARKEVGLDDVFSGDSFYGKQMALEYEAWKDLNVDEEAKDITQEDYQMAALNTRAFGYESIRDTQENKEFWVNIGVLAVIIGATVLAVVFPPVGVPLALGLGVVYGSLEAGSAISGKDWISGRELGTGERWFRGVLAPLDIIPGAAALKKFSGVAKVTSFAGDLGKIGKTTAQSSIRKVNDLSIAAGKEAASRLKSVGAVMKERAREVPSKLAEGAIGAGKVVDETITNTKKVLSNFMPASEFAFAGGAVKESIENTHGTVNAVKYMVSKIEGLNIGGKGVSGANLKNIESFINGSKKFDDVLDDYAKVYREHVESNRPWSWDDNIPGGDSLSSSQKRKIKEMAISKKHIPKIVVNKVEGMRYGFADFANAGVVKETVHLPEEFWRFSDKQQFKWLDEQIGGTRKRMTWHHTEVPGKMELVPFGIHNITPHNGGRTKGMWADAPR